MFSYEFCEPFKDTFLYRTPLVVASVILLKLGKMKQPEKGIHFPQKEKILGNSSVTQKTIHSH